MKAAEETNYGMQFPKILTPKLSEVSATFHIMELFDAWIASFDCFYLLRKILFLKNILIKK